MKTKHIIIYIILLFGIIFSIYILTQSFYNEEWGAVAGSLAVIAALIGSFSTQRIIRKQEEELEPNIFISLDLKSRVGLSLLNIENLGGSTAFDIQIVWEKPLIDRKGKIVQFKSGDQNIDFKSLPKGQKYSYYINSTQAIYDQSKEGNEHLEFYGKINYKKKKNGLIRYSDDFFVTFEPHRTGLQSEDEVQRFLNKSSNIHEDLKNINTTLNKAFNK